MAAPLTHAQTVFYDGHRRLLAGDLKGAQDHFEMALLLDPDFSEAMTNLGLLSEQAGALALAEQYYRRSIALLPGEPQAHLNLAVLLLNAKRFAEAQAVQHRLLQLAPDLPAAWSAMGLLMSCMGRHDEAERCYGTALTLDPGYAKARFNLSYQLLRRGAMREGWAAYEAREHFSHLTAHFTGPPWRGETLAGKSLVIGFEGGHGDMIQFSRYVPLLKARGARRVSLVCPPSLARLFATLPGIDQVLPSDQPVPVAGWDFWSAPMSLPFYCDTQLADIPAPIPYLSACTPDAARWAARLPKQGRRVGLVWKGNPRFENDADRSLPSLATLAPLGAVPGLQLVSLQKGAGEAQVHQRPAGLQLLPFGEMLADFADTAGLIANLDLVIGIDSAVVHLAGAMGKPCWLLLSDYRTDWRWMSGRSDTPWYPTLRLFRQDAHGGGWAPVIDAVCRALN